MTEQLEKSWVSDEQLDNLSRIKRNNEITKGVVRSVGRKQVRLLEDGKYVTREVEVAFLALEGGVTAYCPAHEFSEHEYKSLNGFTGSIQEFVIDYLDLEGKVATVSIRKADELKKNAFYRELEALEQAGKLKDKVFEGIVSGFNPESERIFVKVNGADTFMLKYDWDWGRIRNVSEQFFRGEKIQVKVVRFDKERDMIRVSRKDTFEDPFAKLEQLKDMDSVAGKITNVDSTHGIFVMLDIGLEVKGQKPSHLPEPVVGDIVSCRVRHIDKAKRHAKVVIVGYPRGQKKRNDLASFLFE